MDKEEKEYRDTMRRHRSDATAHLRGKASDSHKADSALASTFKSLSTSLLPLWQSRPRLFSLLSSAPYSVDRLWP